MGCCKYNCKPPQLYKWQIGLLWPFNVNKNDLSTMNDDMTAVLLRDFLKCLKSTCLNLKPGIAWQKA